MKSLFIIAAAVIIIDIGATVWWYSNTRINVNEGNTNVIEQPIKNNTTIITDVDNIPAPTEKTVTPVVEQNNSAGDSAKDISKEGPVKISDNIKALQVPLKKPESKLMADFKFSPNSGTAPLIVSFTSASTGSPTSWAWDFKNDGTAVSASRNPNYTYTTAGTYSVKLTVTNTSGSDSKISLINVSAPLNILPPTADFLSSVVSGVAPLTVSFTNASTGSPTSWAWDFKNDGSATSTLRSPTYTYATAGTYTVKMTATNASGSDSKTSLINVSASSNIPLPVADFTASPVSGTAPLSVSFTSASTGSPTSWAWDFKNDGSATSTSRSPNYTYATAGTYTVKLTVANASGLDSKTGLINVSAIPDIPPPTADFTASTVSGTIPLTVSFTDTSINSPATWLWDFKNDGTAVSASRNPTYTYTTAAIYTAKLTVTNASGSNSKTVLINASAVPDIPPPTANFTASPLSGTVPLTVSFTNSSTGSPTSWAWDFKNDGTATSTSQNPTYVYTVAGTYTAKLTVTNVYGSNSKISSIIVNAPLPPPPTADFAMSVVSGTAPLSVSFTDTSTDSPTSWAWDFKNDGTATSTSQNPTYIYTTAGNYVVKFTATNAYGSTFKTGSIIMSAPIVPPPTANFTASPLSGTAPLAVSFTDTSTDSPTSWAWDFKNDGTATSTLQNPTYTYTAAGTYTVKLTATNTHGSNSKTMTNYITVSDSGGAVSYTTFNGQHLSLYPYEGTHIALLVPSSDLDLATLQRIVSVLDAAYSYYQQANNREPQPYFIYNNRASIAVVPSTCGAGCGYLGYTGIELATGTFQSLYNGVKDNNQFDQAVFYELGRNFWFYESKLEYHSPDSTGAVTTGYAVFMRFKAMDAAGAAGGPFNSHPFEDFRTEVKNMLTYYLNQSMTWDNSLKIGQGPTNSMGLGASDLFAAFMFKLNELYGDAFINQFWQKVALQPVANTSQEAVDNFIISASITANQNLTSLFETTWHWPISAAARQQLIDRFGM
jgi:PKD repeat protein